MAMSCLRHQKCSWNFFNLSAPARDFIIFPRNLPESMRNSVLPQTAIPCFR